MSFLGCGGKSHDVSVMQLLPARMNQRSIQGCVWERSDEVIDCHCALRDSGSKELLRAMVRPALCFTSDVGPPLLSDRFVLETMEPLIKTWVDGVVKESILQP